MLTVLRSIPTFLMIAVMMVSVACADSAPEIRTPKERPQPRLTGPKIFGVRPNHPVLHRITATGKEPISFFAKGLPKGVRIDKKTGLISGSCTKPGRYECKIAARNSLGTAKRNFTLVVGEDLALTPPMGFSSWYCFSEGVTDERIRTAARGMAERGLAKHGWTYINIDDCWQGVRDGREGPIQGNERFPDMKSLCDYVHSLGLKIGIYSTPWMSTYAGHVGGSINSDGFDLAEYLPEEKRKAPTQFYGSWPGKLKKLGKTGDTWLFDKDVKQWAIWGFDYVKVDWLPNDIPQTSRILENLRGSGRDIVLSLSNAAPFKNAEGLSALAQLWRTTGDIKDSWGSIMGNFRRNAQWQKFARPGHWNDPDILQVGMIGTASSKNASYRPTKLTPDECYTQVSLWAIAAAPMIISCDLAGMDDFTYGLLTNDEILDINQDLLGVQGEQKYKKDGIELWVKPLEGGDCAVAVLNDSNDEKTFTLTPDMLGMSAFKVLRDVWRQKDLPHAKPLTITLPRHATFVYRIRG